MVSGQTYQLAIKSGITCSTTHDLKLSYTKVKVDGYEVPEWVSFNDQTSNLELTTPALDYDQIYEFSIETKVEGKPDVYTKSFKLHVEGRLNPNIGSTTNKIFEYSLNDEPSQHRALQTD